MPIDAVLSQNSPNPFNAGTTITFVLHEREQVRLEVLNVLGQSVVILMEGEMEAGSHTYAWDGRDGAGEMVPSGVYLYRLLHGAKQESRHMILLR